MPPGVHGGNARSAHAKSHTPADHIGESPRILSELNAASFVPWSSNEDLKTGSAAEPIDREASVRAGDVHSSVLDSPWHSLPVT
jgi:hypothetical protein